MVAVDIPSGVDGLTGAVQGTAVQATSTVTFAARKPGLVFEPGRSQAGRIRVVDIGIDLGPDGADPPPIACYDADDVAPAPPAPAADRAQVDGGRDGRGRIRRDDRRADVREPRGDACRRRHRLVRPTG